MRAPSPCKRICPATGEIIGIVEGRAYRSTAKFMRTVGQQPTPRVLETISIETLEQLGALHRIAEDASSRSD
jgi:hypothetical protein